MRVVVDHPTPMSSTKASLRAGRGRSTPRAKLTRKGRRQAGRNHRRVRKDRQAVRAARGTDGLRDRRPYATAKNSDDVSRRGVRPRRPALHSRLLSGVDEFPADLPRGCAAGTAGVRAGSSTSTSAAGFAGTVERASTREPESGAVAAARARAGSPASGLPEDPPGAAPRCDCWRDWLATEMADAGARVLDAGAPDLTVATSKTFPVVWAANSLARRPSWRGGPRVEEDH